MAAAPSLCALQRVLQLGLRIVPACNMRSRQQFGAVTARAAVKCRQWWGCLLPFPRNAAPSSDLHPIPCMLRCALQHRNCKQQHQCRAVECKRTCGLKHKCMSEAHPGCRRPAAPACGAPPPPCCSPAQIAGVVEALRDDSGELETGNLPAQGRQARLRQGRNKTSSPRRCRSAGCPPSCGRCQRGRRWQRPAPQPGCEGRCGVRRVCSAGRRQERQKADEMDAWRGQAGPPLDGSWRRPSCHASGQHPTAQRTWPNSASFAFSSLAFTWSMTAEHCWRLG